MIKRTSKLVAVAFSAALLLTSCYSYTTVVGTGGTGQQEVTEWNHYVVYGLAPIDVSDPSTMNGDADNYTVHTRHTFINGLVASLTFGIYTPTTTTVTR